MKTCYHGTNEKNAQSILKEGFRDETWFARNLQDAIGFGGLHIFKVAFDHPPDNWQFLSEAVPPDRIVEYAVYTKAVVIRNEALGKMVFESNFVSP